MLRENSFGEEGGLTFGKALGKMTIIETPVFYQLGRVLGSVIYCQEHTFRLKNSSIVRLM